MAAFRLSYPASIYATVVADNLDAAKDKLVAALLDIENGTNFHIDIDQKQRTDGRVYPDCNGDGVELSKIGL